MCRLEMGSDDFACPSEGGRREQRQLALARGQAHELLDRACALLFVGRVIYRMMVLYSQNPYAAQTPQDFSSSPLTLGIFGLLAGYYVTYAIGLVRWRQGVSESKDVPASTGS